MITVVNKYCLLGSLVWLLLCACNNSAKQEKQLLSKQEQKRQQQSTQVQSAASEYPTIGYVLKLDEALTKIVKPSAKIEVIASGHNWSEGPVWVEKDNCLLYSDVPENIIYKWTSSKGKETYLSPSGYTGEGKKIGSNGLTLDAEGKLILCQSGDRVIARMKNKTSLPKADYEILASKYAGAKFSSPNDIVMDNDGNFYFTDPGFGLKDTTLIELDFKGVFRINPKGTVQLVTKSCLTPNGIGLSPDERTLYVANSRPAELYAWDLASNGTVTNERLLFDANELWQASVSRQPPDGMAVNKAGIIFMTGPDGVLIITPDGKHIGTIKTDKLTSNCAFNNDESILYVTCDDLVLRVILKD